MTKVLGKDGLDKIVGGAYSPDQVQEPTVG
jgi:hypothetical protein